MALFGKKKPKKDDAPAPADAAGDDGGAPAQTRTGLFRRIVRGLSKTRARVVDTIGGILLGRGKIDDDLLDDIEDALLSADMGPDVTDLIVDRLRQAWKAKQIEDASEILPFLKRDIRDTLAARGNELARADEGCSVVLVCGVNGTGKTTSIGKLAARFKAEGAKVLIAAGDTFRAAAENQLKIWATERAGVDFIQAPEGVTDPAAVAHMAAEKARDEGYDVLLLDTAGRLHTQKNLMQQLGKMKRVLGKQIDGAPHEVLMVLDATTGQNAINQALLFKDAAGVTGLFLAKLDSSAKGGVVLAINEKVEVPVKFIGTGEQIDDIAPFDAKQFVDALFEGIDDEESAEAPSPAETSATD